MYENSLDALADGAIITVVGMAIVFGFLTIMVFAMNITSGVIAYLNKKFPEAVKEEPVKKKKTSQSEDEAIAVAIAAAIKAQRA